MLIDSKMAHIYEEERFINIYILKVKAANIHDENASDFPHDSEYSCSGTTILHKQKLVAELAQLIRLVFSHLIRNRSLPEDQASPQ
jgi:hypothetical protein